MSVLIREACQEALDKYGLTDFHAGMDICKVLTIYTECGNRVFSAKGVEFSRKNPSKAEIQASVDLLYEYLAKNKNQINQIIQLKKKYFKNPSKY